MSERIKLRDRREFYAAIKALNRVIARVRKYEPDACYYMECESMHLMTGESHDDSGATGLGRSHPERSALSAIIDHADCGAW